MTTIVREHYPAAKLPAELRVGLDGDAVVTISVTVEEPVEDEALTLDDIFALARRSPRRGADEIDADLRALRGEWDERG